MGKKKTEALEEPQGDIQEPSPLVEAEAPAEEEASLDEAQDAPEVESDLATLLPYVDAGKPVAILCSSFRAARKAVLDLDKIAGDRTRTLSQERARLGFAGGSVVRGFCQAYQMRAKGKKLGAVLVLPGCNPRLLDALRRNLNKEAVTLGLP